MALLGRWYRYAGLWVLSEINLPEWAAFACVSPQAEADITIRWTVGGGAEFVPLLTPEQYRFRVQDIADYRVCGGSEIWIAPHAGAGEREIRLFLLGSAWGALCYQRGLLALHMSVVAVNGRAVGFCGVSGAGKSTCAAWLAARGYPLVADDLCHVDLGGDTPGVHPAPLRLKLWQDALHRLGWETTGLERDHFRMEKFHLSRPADGSPSDQQGWMAPVPLAAIYVLAWGDLAIQRLRGLDGLTALVEAATYRGELLEPMGQIAVHWERCVHLARRIHIYRFSRPQKIGRAHV